jgi:hypothetical protein
MTAQGAGRASKIVPVMERVIGLAWYKVWYAAGYASAGSFDVSPLDRDYSISKRFEEESIKQFPTQVVSNYLIRWRAFDFSFLKTRRKTDVISPFWLC